MKANLFYGMSFGWLGPFAVIYFWVLSIYFVVTAQQQPQPQQQNNHNCSWVETK